MSPSIPTLIRQHLQANDAVQDSIDFEEITSRLEADEPFVDVPSTPHIANRGIWVAAAAAVITLLLLGLIPLLSGGEPPPSADTSPPPTTPTTAVPPSTTATPPSAETPTATSIPVAPASGVEDSTEGQPSEQAQTAPVDDEAFDVILDFIDAWKARDADGMGRVSSSDLFDSDIQWLVDLGTPAGEPYECRQWEDDHGPVAQCYIEIPGHGQYEQETHYVLARPHADGPWEVTWAAALTQ